MSNSESEASKALISKMGLWSPSAHRSRIRGLGKAFLWPGADGRSRLRSKDVFCRTSHLFWAQDMEDPHSHLKSCVSSHRVSREGGSYQTPWANQGVSGVFCAHSDT